MKRIMLSLLPLIFLAGNAFSQLLNLPKGKTFEITNSHTDKGTYKNTENYTYSFRSLGKDANGNFVLETRIVQAVINDSESQYRQLNTDSVRKTALNSTGPIFSLAMLNKPFKVIVSPQGKIISVTGVKEVLSASMNKWDINPETQQNIFANAESFPQTVGRLFYQNDVDKLPTEVGVKAKNTDVPFTLTNKNATTVTMQSSNVNGKEKTQKKYVIDLKTGLIESGVTTSENVIEDSPLPLVAKKVTISSVTKQSLRPVQQRKAVDTTWINAALKLSYWSNAYKKGQYYDSTKVAKLLTVKDPKLLNDPYFVSRRLNAVQGVRGSRTYERYDSLLILTPNRLLEGDYSHLHNKLGESLEKLGADSAYEVTKYAIRTDAMEQWTQQSFAQAFLGSPGDDKERIERLARSYNLLNLIKGNKDTKFQQLITPLYLWANTLRDANDMNTLNEAGKALAALNDDGMKKGNGGRYSLLIYQKLLAAKQDALATKLLDTTIKKLERYAADTLYKERFAEQNMLAGAYFMKSASAKALGDSSHVSYLARAAKYSPKNSNEKAYSSFYDRAFLKTKESYKEEYMEKMLTTGNEQEALNMFSENINAMPESIAEMQKLFIEKFPQKDFKTFFYEKIVNTWAVAPGFNVKGIDGKQRTRNDYKDKWLVMDFWGTWCSPCREEMPVVNKFGVEVAEGKHPNISFLSVACSDTEPKVISYLTENKFTMAAAMSDGQIERAYKIKGYPSKIMVSPQGRMIDVGFGKDWQAIIKTFSSL